MHMSQLFSTTLRSAGRTEFEGHQLLLRAGMLRQLGQGIFSALPLGWRSLRKIEDILRAEQEAIGGQELSLPVVQPAEVWQATGRYDEIGPELARFTDRRDRPMVLAMTHEEVVVDLCRTEIASYRDLPRLVFQLQTKFRDDPRPRAGLIRVREFRMKDAYSLDADPAGLDRQYEAQFRAYEATFARCGLPVLAVAADVGMMGGSQAHEFMYATPIGEDTLLLCDHCGYRANRQVATIRKPAAVAEPLAAVEEFATPDATTIEALVGLGIPIERTAKALFLAVERRGQPMQLVLALVRGDRELNETKLANVVHGADIRPMTEAEIAAIGAVPGYGSPVGVTGATVVVDEEVQASPNLVGGANRVGFHLRNLNAGRDYTVDHVADITAAAAGDACDTCGSALRSIRGVEVGNIFKLGDRYSAAVGATYLDPDGQRRPIIMGSYGIGVGRLLACIAEEHHDERGLRLPVTVAPYQVHLCALDRGDVAEQLCTDLRAAGVEVLHDDRGHRPGVQFADADLIGAPLRLTVGQRSLAHGGVEVRSRATGESTVVPLDDLVPQVRAQIAELFAVPGFAVQGGWGHGG